MASRRPLPASIASRAFTVTEALACGLSRRMLQGSRFVKIHPGIYASAQLEQALTVLVAADLLTLPADVCLSHTTALHWYGVTVGSASTRHYSTNSTSQTRLKNVVLHRRLGTLHPRMLHGVRILGPDRTLVDCGTVLDSVDLVRAGDWLVRLGLTTPDVAQRYSEQRHLDGVVRTRSSATLVRERVDSVRETDVRLTLVACRLPEPETNGVIRDDRGRFLARGDLVYRRWKIVIEYDGWHHERNAEQRSKDILRRERLEAAGWRVIVVTHDDMGHPTSVVARVWEALSLAGYAGSAPVYDRARIRTLRDL
ncbi:DUF559 domain-containing protein [Aeromicrobium sp.]|uniref:DUF559 domain-containing protein n=1 Tax=Aeromicrobium sp. TaxID=1871063 RepID=UPI003C6A36C3